MTELVNRYQVRGLYPDPVCGFAFWAIWDTALDEQVEGGVFHIDDKKTAEDRAYQLNLEEMKFGARSYNEDQVKFIQDMVANRQALKEPPLQIEEEELTIEQKCAKTLPEITLFFCGGCGARAKMCMGDCYPDEVMKPRVAIRYVPVGRADV